MNSTATNRTGFAELMLRVESAEEQMTGLKQTQTDMVTLRDRLATLEASTPTHGESEVLGLQRENAKLRADLISTNSRLTAISTENKQQRIDIQGLKSGSTARDTTAENRLTSMQKQVGTVSRASSKTTLDLRLLTDTLERYMPKADFELLDLVSNEAVQIMFQQHSLEMNVLVDKRANAVCEQRSMMEGGQAFRSSASFPPPPSLSDLATTSRSSPRSCRPSPCNA